MKKQIILSLAAFTLIFIVTGCQRPGPKFNPQLASISGTNQFQTVEITNRIQQEWLRSPTNEFTLGPGDKLEIELLNDPTSRVLTSVGPDGKIYFSLLPGLDVWGLTLTETRQLLESEMAKYVREKAAVGVTLRGVESKRVWLLGRFQAPGVYPIAAPMTLLEALSLGGGTLNFVGNNRETLASLGEELADLRRSFVIRDGKPLPVDFQRLLKEGDLSQNIYLQPDDFIFLPGATAREVYLMGAVVTPRPIPYMENMTLAAAIATAAGTFKESYLSHVAIVRGSLSEPKIAIVDYKEIINGRAPDVRIEPQDIIYVPFKPYRTLSRYMDLILNTFATSVAINEGSRAAVDTPPAPAGILIPLGSRITVQPSPAPTR